MKYMWKNCVFKFSVYKRIFKSGSGRLLEMRGIRKNNSINAFMIIS